MSEAMQLLKVSDGVRCSQRMVLCWQPIIGHITDYRIENFLDNGRRVQTDELCR